MQKKENKRKKQKEEKNVDPNRLKKPASSFLLFSKEERKKIVEEKPGTNNRTVNALISLKWKLSGGNLAYNIPPNNVLITSIEDIYLKKQLGEYWVAGCIVDVESG
nr:high mobility group B protein 6-like isoform X2 [Ipomoea batatas]